MLSEFGTIDIFACIEIELVACAGALRISMDLKDFKMCLFVYLLNLPEIFVYSRL